MEGAATSPNGIVGQLDRSRVIVPEGCNFALPQVKQNATGADTMGRSLTLSIEAASLLTFRKESPWGRCC
jgi:hypothetical protein